MTGMIPLFGKAVAKMWHILGSGAIGSIWASKLNSLNLDITLIFRDEERLDNFATTGNLLSVQSDKGLHQFHCLATTANQLLTPIQNLLVATKAFDAIRAITALKNRLTPESTIVVMINGYGVQQELSARFPHLNFTFASTTDGGYKTGEFETVWAGQGKTVVGSIKGKAMTPMAWEALSNLETTDEIDLILWRKLAINCCINPLTVKYNCRNGELLDIPAAMADMSFVASEFEAISNTTQKQLFDTPLLDQAKLVARATQENISSMLQDIRAGRRTEIHQITGALCDLAEQSAIAAPHNQALLKLIIDLEKTAN
jgi:2-dehydropantoate 2-reductase